MAIFARMHADSRQAWRHLPLAVVLGCSLYAVGFWAFAGSGTLPYEAAADVVKERWQAGDAVAIRPWWAARIREHLGDRPFVQVRDLAAEDLSRFARLWVLSLPGHHRGPGGPFDNGTYRMAEEHELDGLLLRLYELPAPAEVVYDFRENLKQARVAIRGKTRRKACDRWIENRWQCSGRDWNYVGRMIVELGDDPREVIWAHPVDEGPIEIVYPNVPGGRELLVHTGLTPAAARIRTHDAVPVDLEVRIDGRRVATVVQPNETGFFPHPIDVSTLGPGPHAVTFRVSAKRTGMRHFCFTAEMRR